MRSQFSISLFFILLALIFTVVSGSALGASTPVPGAKRALKTGDYTGMADAPAPLGFRDYCARHESDCHQPAMNGSMVSTTALWRKMVAVNSWVNRAITYRLDREEYWEDLSLAGENNLVGDCEEYVLLKRRLLIEGGFDPAALFMLVVRDGFSKDYHLVLGVRTSGGVFILDNNHALPQRYRGKKYYPIRAQDFSRDSKMVWAKLRDY